MAIKMEHDNDKVSAGEMLEAIAAGMRLADASAPLKELLDELPYCDEATAARQRFSECIMWALKADR